MSNVEFSQFLAWEATTRDTIDFKTIYVDMTGDLIAGLLLSQIVYWHLPNRNGASKLRVKKGGKLWVAKKRTDWWDEIRITAYQYDRASQILKDKGLVEIELYRFNGSPTHHIRLIRETFLAVFRQNLKSISDCDENPIEVESNIITETTAKTAPQTTADLPPQTAVNSPPPLQTVPAKETPLARIARRRAQCNSDPLSLAADCAEAQAASDKPASWTVPPAAGGVNAFSDGPLTAFCQLAGIPQPSLSDKQRQQWAAELAKIAETWGINAHELCPCIEALSQDDGYSFKSYSTPFNYSFAADVGVFCARSKQGEPLVRRRGNGKDGETKSEPAAFDAIREWLTDKEQAQNEERLDSPS